MTQLQSINVSKASGPDECHPKLLYECANELHIPIYKSFVKSITEGQIPSDWKKANVTCIHKKGSKCDPRNYRPVSLTSVVCKLLEKHIEKAIFKHLIRHNLLSDCQYCFREHCSTVLQLLDVLEDSLRTSALDDNYQLDTIYFDFAKAFDTVPHQRLLTKLQSYGIAGNLLDWIESFLYNRQQRVHL